ncbi:hypothetical protein V8C42DRAFT_195014 [Trichoderma barbatum]
MLLKSDLASICSFTRRTPKIHTTHHFYLLTLIAFRFTLDKIFAYSQTLNHQAANATTMDTNAQEKGTLAWTEEAKFQFLLRIVAQLKGDGRGIKWEKIHIPGRTVKSLQNMWSKINKQINEFEARENSGEGSAVIVPAKPRKRGPPRKKGLAKGADHGDDGLNDEDLDVKPAFSKKRAVEDLDDGNVGTGKKRTKVKAEAMAGGVVHCKKEQK